MRFPCNQYNSMFLYCILILQNFSFLDCDVPRRPSYGVYISQLIRFARVCSIVEDFNARNKYLTVKLLKQGLISVS